MPSGETRSEKIKELEPDLLTECTICLGHFQEIDDISNVVDSVLRGSVPILLAPIFAHFLSPLFASDSSIGHALALINVTGNSLVPVFLQFFVAIVIIARLFLLYRSNRIMKKCDRLFEMVEQKEREGTL